MLLLLLLLHSFKQRQCQAQLAAHSEHVEQVQTQICDVDHLSFRAHPVKAVPVCIRVLLALPAALCVKVKDGEGRTTLECNKLIEHINQHQVSCSILSLLTF